MKQEQQQLPEKVLSKQLSKEDYLTAWLLNWWQTAVLLDPTVQPSDWLKTASTMLRMLAESSSNNDAEFGQRAEMVVQLVRDELNGPREIIKD